MRIEREQHDLVRVPFQHRAGRFIAERMPIAHGHETPDILLGQSGLQGPGLRLGELQQGRFAAHHRIIGSGRLGAGIGDDPRQNWPHEERHAQNRGIGEQIDQKRAHRRRLVGAAQVEQHDSRLRFGHVRKMAGNRTASSHVVERPVLRCAFLKE
jgi:hypothetical protein